MSQLRRLLNARSKVFTRGYATKSERRKQHLTESASPFPEKLLNRKMKTPDNLYMCDRKAASLILSSVQPFLQQLPPECDTALELNPGIGLLSEQLMQEQRFRKIVLMETLQHFLPNLHKLKVQQPERIKLRQGDLVGLWKLDYQDKFDNGTRVANLLQDVPLRAYNDVPNMVLFGAVGSYQFFKHLINSLVFQNSLLALGRCEMFLVMPPPIYIHLTCRGEIGYLFYRATSLLFQMFFEYRFITRVPREYFLPQQSKYNLLRNNKLAKIQRIDPESLYLVKIVPRRELFNLCSAPDLSALWYFVKQNCMSRRNRVIPNLEKIVPGCGPRLIINTETPQPVQPLFADEDPAELPQYSHRCTTMSAHDFFPRINIYTQFGDLSASQLLTLFRQFRHWPEYSESSFLASLENSMLRMEAAADESVDGIGLLEEDDVAAELEEPNATADAQKQTERNTKTRKGKRKADI